jgi:pimeloyl-ACP methyl ester carboxylesterase
MKGNYQRLPLAIVYQEQAAFKDTYAGAENTIFLEANYLKPENPITDTALVFMHPAGAGGAYLPMPTALARSGIPVIYCNSRYRGVDSGLIMEKVVLDLAACIKEVKEKLGYKKIVLAGWSGGGSLSLFYQSQAENPTLTSTPAGDPPNLKEVDLPQADGLMLLAAHCSRATTLTEWLDPSITDESKPEIREREFNLYDPLNPNQPPYSKDFIEEFRKRQIDRNKRITDWALTKLESFQGDPTKEYGFVVHGTMADPRWLDAEQEPNDRKTGWCYLGDPKVVNDSPIGLSRFSSIRSWLSQFSYELSEADGEKCGRNTSVPTLVIGNSADDACPPSHNQRLYDSITHERRKLHIVKGANHYYFGQKEELSEAVQVSIDWLKEENLI